MSHIKSKWIIDSKLTINLDKTNIFKLKGNNSPQHSLNTGSDGKHTAHTGKTRVLVHKPIII
jgi:hypothetical protein